MKGKWSWATAGILLGLLNLIIFLSGNHLGTTTFYAQTTGYLTNFFFPDWIPISTWTKGTCGGGATLSVSWQWLFVVGLIIGALAGNKTSKVKNLPEKVPPMWAERFGPSPAKRYLAAFVGGFLLLMGSRMAGGCTSSHVISGMSQMAISGIVFGVAVFAAGIPTALLLYKGGKPK